MIWVNLKDRLPPDNKRQFVKVINLAKKGKGCLIFPRERKTVIDFTPTTVSTYPQEMLMKDGVQQYSTRLYDIFWLDEDSAYALRDGKISTILAE